MSDVAAVNVSFRYNKTGRPSKTYGGKWWYNGKVKTELACVNGTRLLNITIDTNGFIREGEHNGLNDDGKKIGVVDNNQVINLHMTEIFALELATAILARLEDKEDNDFSFTRTDVIVRK